MRQTRLNRRDFLAASMALPVLARAAAKPKVLTGLDSVIQSGGAPLLGKRVGVLVHAASLTQDGTHAVDALLARGVKLTKLFGAEHGFRGLAAAGEKVDDAVDAKSGLPVISLYGKKSKPLPEDLEGLDAF